MKSTYKDIISYELAEGISEAHLLSIAEEVLNSWMSKQPGFLGWEIHKTSEGIYSDIVHWASKEDAKAAEKDMANIPNGADWYGCYKQGSISSKNLHLVKKF